MSWWMIGVFYAGFVVGFVTAAILGQERIPELADEVEAWLAGGTDE